MYLLSEWFGIQCWAPNKESKILTVKHNMEHSQHAWTSTHPSFRSGRETITEHFFKKTIWFTKICIKEIERQTYKAMGFTRTSTQHCIVKTNLKNHLLPQLWFGSCLMAFPYHQITINPQILSISAPQTAACDDSNSSRVFRRSKKSHLMWFYRPNNVFDMISWLTTICVIFPFKICRNRSLQKVCEAFTIIKARHYRQIVLSFQKFQFYFWTYKPSLRRH